MECVSVLDAGASAPRVVAEELGFQEAGYDAIGRAAELIPQSSTKALNMNMGYRSPPVEGNSYVVDIKGGQHFGERQGINRIVAHWSSALRR